MAKNKTREPKSKVLTQQMFIFAVVVAAVTGYLFFQAGNEAPAPPAASPSPPAPAAQALAAGDTLPVVPLMSLTGEPLELRAPSDARPVLLFVFSPTCSICHETLPVWKELYQAAQAQAVEVVGLSVLPPATTAQYVRANEVPWNVYSFAGNDAIRTMRIERVPFTVLLDGTGRISLAIGGRLTADQQAEIARAFETETPG